MSTEPLGYREAFPAPKRILEISRLITERASIPATVFVMLLLIVPAFAMPARFAVHCRPSLAPADLPVCQVAARSLAGFPDDQAVLWPEAQRSPTFDGSTDTKWILGRPKTMPVGFDASLEAGAPFVQSSLEAFARDPALPYDASADFFTGPLVTLAAGLLGVPLFFLFLGVFTRARVRIETDALETVITTQAWPRRARSIKVRTDDITGVRCDVLPMARGKKMQIMLVTQQQQQPVPLFARHLSDSRDVQKLADELNVWLKPAG